ncbi:MAG: sigma-70 family RNA polymerase sigma factor [Myxococcales bacterium]|nr:sigma-70 family RNA polymerase sigma factor [Myxococcales bacterium]
MPCIRARGYQPSPRVGVPSTGAFVGDKSCPARRIPRTVRSIAAIYLSSEMDDFEEDAQLRRVTAELAWLRRLARALLRDQDADDLAQEAWLVAAERPPAEARPLRPWLGGVLRNLAKMRARARKRREAREARSAELVEPATTPDDLVERVELQQLVAGEALALAEPYRSTILLHYFEELSCAEIARRLGIPEGTVRRRLKVALDELRARISAKERGGRGGLAALAPIAGLSSPSQAGAPWALGVIAMKKLLVLVIALILIILAGVLWSRRDHQTAATHAPTDEHGSAVATATTTTTPGGTTAATERDDVPRWLVQPDVKRRRIAGRVTFRGVAVAGATVDLASIASEGGLTTAPHVTTNDHGEFDFGAQSAMQWSVRASAPGKASARHEVDLRDPRAIPAPDRLELELGACDAALVGTVRDASGGLIAKARISRLRDDGAGVPGGPATQSDENGAYELCVEPRWPGWVIVEASADGYAAVTLQMIVPGRTKVDFALVPEAVIVGRVIRDDTSAPVPQAYVFVPPGSEGIESTPLRGSFTDAAGRFRIDRMTAGRHLVFARAEGLVETTQGTPVVVGVGQTSVEIEIRLETGSTIRGKVVDDGKPIAGARVNALDGSRSTASAVSQDDGTFTLSGVPRDDLRFTAQPYEVVSPKTFRVSEAVHEGVTIEVDALGTIVGHVIRGKQPVPGANIQIHGPNDRELETVRADATGRFEVHGLQPGPWTLYASATAGEPSAGLPRPFSSRAARLPRSRSTWAFGERSPAASSIRPAPGARGVRAVPQHEVRRHRHHGHRGRRIVPRREPDGWWRVPADRSAQHARERTASPVAGGEFPPIAVADGERT